MGSSDAAARTKLLDATERVLSRDGYPAVTSRNVGNEAGVNQKLVFYYFQSMEELVVATFRRRSETFLRELEKLKDSPSPIRSLWQLSSHRSGRMVIELMAMASHNEALRREVADYSVKANHVIGTVLEHALRSTRRRDASATPAFVNFAIASMARNLLLESELGLLESPEELLVAVEEWIDHLESEPLPTQR